MASDVLDRVDPARAWLAAFAAAIVTIVGAALLFPREVYWKFLWRYFWGPVVADAHSAACAVRDLDAGRTVIDPATGCSPADAAMVVAEPGYTLVSEVGYMLTLLFMLMGIYLVVLRRFDLEPYSDFFFALVPWMLFGGALRVVEDAMDAVPSGVDPLLSYPENTLLISPVIYGTVFVLALGGLVVATWLERTGRTETYHYPLGGMGVALVSLTVAFLLYLGFTREYVEFHPLVLATVLVLSTVIAVAVYRGFERWRPAYNAGTGLMGVVVLWAHALDGVANVLASDWTWVFGLQEYGAKHPFDAILSNVVVTLDETLATVLGVVDPGWLTGAVGDSWLFLVVKVVVAAAIVSLFDDRFVEESPRFAIVLLGAIVAVGLGPGTRDVLRVTLGI